MLIKSVVQALPTYCMSVFKLPVLLLDDVTWQIRNFWWGAEDGERKVHWIAWDKMIKSKPLEVWVLEGCDCSTKPFLPVRPGV